MLCPVRPIRPIMPCLSGTGTAGSSVLLWDRWSWKQESGADSLNTKYKLACLFLDESWILQLNEYMWLCDLYNELNINDAASGKTLFSMSSPVVYDAEGVHTIARPIIAARNGYYRLTYEIDNTFLASAVYPVTIDPVITTTRDKSVISDTYIWKENPNTNYGDKHMMRCGHGSGGESIALIRLDKLVAQRASDTIISAMLKVYPEEYYSEDEYFACYPIKKPWDQFGATWNSMTPDNDTNIGSNVLSYIDSTMYQYVYFDITDLYRSWYKNGRR